jgi:membrane protein DedA with SNARE-associated domain
MLESVVALIQRFWTDLQLGQLPELGPWNYLLLSLLIVLQGPLATLLGGAAASAGLLRPWLVFLAGITGNLTADILWYRVGRLGKSAWILRAGRFLGVRRHHLVWLQDEMRRHATRILLLAKLSAGFAVPALIAAGLARVRWRRWFPVVFLGESLWTGSLLLIGYFATEGVKQVAHSLRILFGVLTVAMLVSLLCLLPRLTRQAAVLGGQIAEKSEDLRAENGRETALNETAAASTIDR